MRTRVLVADDNRLFCQAVAALLESDPRIEVVGCATNGAEAVDFARKLEPDVVLMDIRMPVMTGIEATSRILARLPETKILVVTAQGSEQEIALGLGAGAVDWVAKDEIGLRIVDSVLDLAAAESRELVASFVAA